MSSFSWLASGVAALLGLSGITVYINSNNGNSSPSNSNNSSPTINNGSGVVINGNGSVSINPPIDNTKTISVSEKPYGCSEMYNNWTTFVKGSQGERKPIFIFTSNHFKYPYTSKRRSCEIADRFNAVKEELKSPKFTSGKINGLGVVCLEENGACKKVLFTMKPGERAEDRIPLLQEHMESSASGVALYEASCQKVFDLNLLAGNASEQKRAVSSVCDTKH